MSRAAHSFERFIRRVHRRQLFIHLIERTALGTLGGCAAALPLIGIALWRDLPGLEIAIAALVMGVIAGLIWGVLTRPTTFAASIEADRQLGWADLMSSALAVQNRSSNDPWIGTLLAVADEHCRTVLPSTVVFNRLGARAWGGIGLATLLVIVLGLMPTYAIPTRAENSHASSDVGIAESEYPDSLHSMATPSLSRRTPGQEDPDDATASRIAGVEPRGDPDAANPSASDQQQANASSTDPNGRGSGASHSDSPRGNTMNSATTGTRWRDASGIGKPSGGAGESAVNEVDGNDTSGQAAGSNGDGFRPAPPWESRDWAAQSQRALNALKDGRIPDAYRDVVRGYFERP